VNTFWEHFTEIITDPAHTAVEFVFVLLDYVVIQTIAHRLKAHFHKDLASEHRAIEIEHGLPTPSESLGSVDHDAPDQVMVTVPLRLLYELQRESERATS
jgi:hypothetical protein